MLKAVHHGRVTEIVITKHGNPLAKLVPIAKGKVAVLGDIFSTGEAWDAERGESLAIGACSNSTGR